jgi:hypothetical protein
MFRLILFLLSLFGSSSSPPPPVVHPDAGSGWDPNG